MSVVASQAPASKVLQISLWTAQVLLAAAFFLAGFTKASTPLAELGASMSWVNDSPGWLPRFIGVSEVLGALGLVLPAATRIKPLLTPLAAALLVVVMVLAAGVHAVYGEWSGIAANFVLAGIAAFVAWGRVKKAPIAAR